MLQLENVRVKQKMKRMQETINGLSGASAETDNLKVGATEADLDYDDIGRDFILVGGLHLRFLKIYPKYHYIVWAEEK